MASGKIVRQSEADPKIQIWLGRLNRIEVDVRDIGWSRDIFRDVLEMIRTNPTINKANQFYDWIAVNYAHSMLMGIRRHVDRDTRSMSMARLLDEMLADCPLLTREMHVALYRRDLRRVGESTFDRLAGCGEPTLPRKIVEDDIARIDTYRDLIKELADRRIAHLDKASKISKEPTFQELDEAIDGLRRLVEKYLLLFRGSTVILSPIPQYDWKAIFRTAWIRKN
jgi:hypothetical protein